MADAADLELSETRRKKVLTRHRLPMAWVTDGQRVPEDLHPAPARDLVNRDAQRVRDRAHQIPVRTVTQAVAHA